MKQFIFSAATLGMLVFNAVSLQQAKGTLPPAVLSDFHKLFPGIKPNSWSVTKSDAIIFFKARDGGDAFAEYDLAGHLIDAGVVIDHDSLPRAVVLAAIKKYPNATIAEVVKIVDASNEITYRLKLSERGKSTLAYFDPDGRAVKRKA